MQAFLQTLPLACSGMDLASETTFPLGCMGGLTVCTSTMILSEPEKESKERKKQILNTCVSVEAICHANKDIIMKTSALLIHVGTCNC